LYQAGYLTLRKKTDSSYALDYPNFEVLSSMSRLFIDNLFPSTVEAGQASLRLEEHVAEGDVPAIVDDIMILYSNLAYDDHAAAKRLSMFIALANDQKAEVTRLLEPAFGRRAILETTKKMTRAVDGDRYQEAISIMEHFIANSGQDKEIRMKLNESFYRSNLHSFLLGAGLRATPEIHSSLGRSDLAIEHKGLAYVIEMKVVEKASSAGTAAQNAIRQIVELGYAGRFVGPLILMSLVVAGDTRNIAACVFVKDGRAERLEFGGSLKKLSDKQPTKEKFDKKGQNKLPAVSQAKKTRAKKTVKDSKS
ncbi:MAG: PD-(D/E)XK nuclease domain-containing protein, partial [Deltaproteobacteria bacterium]|nr:PD-(D/E)XK nuclease domain-containing protein [Deltaproteobacteria bacterium]